MTRIHPLSSLELDVPLRGTNTSLPHVFRAGASRETAAHFVESHRGEIAAALLRDGAVLLRGFALDDPEEFSRIATRIGGPLATSYRGPSPRTEVARGVHSASDVSSAVVVPEHAEISYEPTMPRHLFFWCREASPIGGETTVVDGRLVLAELDPALVAPILDGPLRVRRRHARICGLHDPFELRRWNETFGTEDRAIVAERLARLGQTARFEADGSLTIEHETTLVRTHPVTGDLVFANHLLVFHASTPTAILASAVRHEKALRAAAIFPLAWSYRVLSEFVDREVATDVRLADGAPIPDEVVDHVRVVVDRVAYRHRWQAGDLVILDNHLALHGRRPYLGHRDVVVAWSAEKA